MSFVSGPVGGGGRKRDDLLFRNGRISKVEVDTTMWEGHFPNHLVLSLTFSYTPATSWIFRLPFHYQRFSSSQSIINIIAVIILFLLDIKEAKEQRQLSCHFIILSYHHNTIILHLYTYIEWVAMFQ